MSRVEEYYLNKRNESRELMVHRIKQREKYGIELSPREKMILIKMETYQLGVSFYKKYQLGDPQELSNLYDEMIKLIDEEIAEYGKRKQDSD